MKLNLQVTSDATSSGSFNDGDDVHFICSAKNLISLLKLFAPNSFSLIAIKINEEGAN
jgi:hypothetical protein